MEEAKRMANQYEIRKSIHVGEVEVVFGEDIHSQMPFFCGNYRRKAMLGEYFDCLAGDDYIEMMEIFVDRIKEQLNKVRAEHAKITVPNTKITEDMCDSNMGNIQNQLVAVKASSLRPEYRFAVHQLVYVEDGNGTLEGAYGTACYCKELYSGKNVRFERYQIQGLVKPEYMPDWAKERVAEIRKKNQHNEQITVKKKNNREER